jgi:transcriptional regulator with XRE-family HTH domain
MSDAKNTGGSASLFQKGMGARIRLVREAAGMSRQELANHLTGVKERQLANIEAGIVVIKAEHLEEIARATRSDLQYLAAGDGVWVPRPAWELMADLLRSLAREVGQVSEAQKQLLGQLEARRTGIDS